MSAPLFDPALVRRRLARAERAGFERFLVARAIEDLDERLGAVLRRFPLALDLGSPTPDAARALIDRGRADAVLRIAPLPERTADERVSHPLPHPEVPRSGLEGDLQEARRPLEASFEAPLRSAPQDEGATGRAHLAVGDAEAVPAASQTFDLAVSLLALQSANDLPGALVQARRALKPDGLFVAALLGGETLMELRAAFAQAESDVEGGVSPRVAPFAEVRDLGGLLQRAGFALPVADSERLTVRYADPIALMRDLRGMGLTNALAERRRTPLRRATLMRMVEVYAERFADPDGRVRATFEILWGSGWAPDASQPKPLRPGSAKTRLADALNTVEHKEPAR